MLPAMDDPELESGLAPDELDFDLELEESDAEPDEDEWTE
jgi:hypothetical protein